MTLYCPFIKGDCFKEVCMLYNCGDCAFNVIAKKMPKK